VSYISDVLNVVDVVIQVTQVTHHNIDRHVQLGMAQVGMVVHRRTADIQTHSPFLHRLEELVLSGQVVKDFKTHYINPPS
jgi:hypothetical protein